MLLSPNPDLLAAFAKLWGPLLGLALALDWPGHAGYYQWLSSSNLAIARRRGLGFNASRPYGFLRIPALSCRALNYLNTGLAAMFALSCFAPHLHALWLVAFVLFLLYASQLGQESSMGQHACVPVFGVLVYLGLGVGTRWASGFIKLHLTSLYFAPGLLK
eukprot:gene28497-35338_t